VSKKSCSSGRGGSSRVTGTIPENSLSHRQRFSRILRKGFAGGFSRCGWPHINRGLRGKGGGYSGVEIQDRDHAVVSVVPRDGSSRIEVFPVAISYVTGSD
jgi:hypothetical protein